MKRRALNIMLPAATLTMLSRPSYAQATQVPSAGTAAPQVELGYAPEFRNIERKIREEYSDIESVCVVRKSRVLFEHYNSTPDELRDVQSVTKSILSLAVGAAIRKGAISSLDQPIAKVLGVVGSRDADSDASAVTIRHLLTMTAGYKFQERFSSGTADDLNFLLRRERSDKPGAAFVYDNLSANLLSIGLEAATGQTTSSFTQQSIFQPLGITEFEWAKGSKGHTLGFSGLRLRARDMAKLGELALNGGTWINQQLLPTDFVRAAISPQSVGGRPVGLPYGYLWWVVPSQGQPQTFLASGFGGQFIWVHPPLQLVIATTSIVSSDANRRGHALSLIRSDLFRAAAATVI